MKRFFKALSAVSLAASILIFSAVIYGNDSLPDSVNKTESATVISDGVYSLGTEDTVKVSSFTNSDSEYKAQFKVLDLFPVKEVTVNVTKRKYVAVGGNVFGIKLYTKGVLVVKTDSVYTDNGTRTPSQSAGIKNGDCISHVNGKAIENADGFIKTVENSGGKEMTLSVERDGEKLSLKLKAVKSENGKFRAGLWVRDSSAGIGTLTFYDTENKIFAGLGHGICDVDTGRIMPLLNGEAVRATVNGFYKSSSGDPGELCGVFSDAKIGNLRVNGATGVYGTFEEKVDAKLLPVALESEVKEGKAQVIATVDGKGPQYYDAQITKIYPASGNSERNLIVKITDKELLEKTGGILQGMSGSPIIQDSMLVGAVTHVFVNDPTQGYGIFAHNMVKTVNELAEELMQNAA